MLGIHGAHVNASGTHSEPTRDPLGTHLGPTRDPPGTHPELTHLESSWAYLGPSTHRDPLGTPAGTTRG